MIEIFIKSEYILLGQFLKFSGVITNGGEAKNFLEFNVVIVDGIGEKRRGRKLFPGSVIEIFNEKFIIKKSE